MLLNQEEFTDRFKKHMVEYLGFTTFTDGTPLEEYAIGVASSYYEEYILDDELGPEELAEADIDYREE